ncbi:MAG TPA: squalene/phytoene synthase family protein [Micropepsaceae bacterium]
MPSLDQAACEALVRRVDPDRWLAALFAAAHPRPHLVALYAFYYEVAKTADSVSQPVMGQIRLQWWREAVEEIYAGRARRHEAVQVLAEVVRSHDIPRALLDAMIDAREHDLEETPFTDWVNLEIYADATCGNLMRLAARILGAGPGLDDAAREAGIAYALMGLLRAFGFHAARRRLMLPVAALHEIGLSQEQIFSGTTDAKVTALFALTVKRTQDHLSRVRASRIPRKFLPALLPAALVPGYAKILTQPGFNPFRDVAELSVHRRQIGMLAAMARARV